VDRGRGPGGEDDGLARGEDLGGGLAGDDYAGEVDEDGVAGGGGRAAGLECSFGSPISIVANSRPYASDPGLGWAWSLGVVL